MGSDASSTQDWSVPGALLKAEANHVTRRNGTFKVYVADHDSGEHVVLVRGDVRGHHGVLCRVSSACVMSTALGSAECDCTDQLSAAMELVANDERGGVVALHPYHMAVDTRPPTCRAWARGARRATTRAAAYPLKPVAVCDHLTAHALSARAEGSSEWRMTRGENAPRARRRELRRARG